jgi:hypothetical protein
MVAPTQGISRGTQVNRRAFACMHFPRFLYIVLVVSRCSQGTRLHEARRLFQPYKEKRDVSSATRDGTGFQHHWLIHIKHVILTTLSISNHPRCDWSFRTEYNPDSDEFSPAAPITLPTTRSSLTNAETPPPYRRRNRRTISISTPLVPGLEPNLSAVYTPTNTLSTISRSHSPHF